MYQKKTRGIRPWMAGVAVLAVVVWLFYALGNILTPFIVAAVLAYILNPLVEKLRDKGMKRGLAAMLVMIFSLVLILALTLVIVPMLVNQFNNMVARLPQIVDFVQNKVLPWINMLLGGHLTLDTPSIVAWLQSHTGSVRDALQRIMPTLMKQVGTVVLGVTNLFLLPFLLYYFLLDWQRWAHGIRAMVPRRYVGTYQRISGNMDKVLGEFLRGQLMVMLIMGLIYGFGLMFVGLDSGFAIGMIAGMLMEWGVFAIGQFLESFFITPQIVGDRIGLSPFWVIFSLMAFGQLMGFVGMLVGLPLAAVTLVLLREGVDAYFKSGFYRQEQE